MGVLGGGGGLMQPFAKSSTCAICPEKPKVARAVQLLHIRLIQDVQHSYGAHGSCVTCLSAPMYVQYTSSLLYRAKDTSVWAVKVFCGRSQLRPLLSCTMADSALTLEVDDAATSVPRVSPPCTQPHSHHAHMYNMQACCEVSCRG